MRDQSVTVARVSPAGAGAGGGMTGTASCVAAIASGDRRPRRHHHADHTGKEAAAPRGCRGRRRSFLQQERNASTARRCASMLKLDSAVIQPIEIPYSWLGFLGIVVPHKKLPKNIEDNQLVNRRKTKEKQRVAPHPALVAVIFQILFIYQLVTRFVRHFTTSNVITDALRSI
jgi:hypothetical protein